MKNRYLLASAVALVLSASIASAQTLRMTTGADVPVFDPHLATGLVNIGITTLVAETLTKLDPHTGEPIPNLAVSWAANGSVWTLQLREGVSFTDGTPFNAEAVKFNLERIMNPETGSPGRGRLGSVAEVRVVDEHTVEIETNGPFAPLPRFLAEPSIGMNSPTQVQALGANYPSAPIGTGPFLFVEHVRGSHVTLRANPEYWGEGPEFAEIQIPAIPDLAARVLALEAGDVDLIYDLPPTDLERIRSNPDLEVIEGLPQRAVFLTMNTEWGPLQDKRVRQAINYAIDSEAIVESIFKGMGEPATSIITRNSFGYSPQTPYNDPEKARSLLAEAGYADGFDVVITYAPGQYAMDAQVLAAIQAMLGQVGVRVTLQPVEWALLQQRLFAEPSVYEIQMNFSATSNGVLDASKGMDIVHPAHLPPNGWNHSLYVNERVGELLDEAAQTVDPVSRQSLYEEAQAIVWEDAPIVFLYIQPSLHAKSARLQDVWIAANETFELRFAHFE